MPLPLSCRPWPSSAAALHPSPLPAPTLPPRCLCLPARPPAVQPRWEQEDAHDFLEYLVDRMHQEWARLSGGGAALSATAASAAANAAKAAEEDEWLTRSGRRTTKRQPLKTDSETTVSGLFRGTTLRWASLWRLWDVWRGWAAAFAHVASCRGVQLLRCAACPAAAPSPARATRPRRRRSPLCLSRSTSCPTV